MPDDGAFVLEVLATALRPRIQRTVSEWADAELVKRRLDVARVIGESKRQTGRAVLDPKREAAVRRTYYEALPGSKQLADKLVDLLIEAARAQQSIEE